MESAYNSKKNPLSESEASSISPIIEAFLKHEVDRYQRNKKSRYNPTRIEDSALCAIEETKSQSSDYSALNPKELYSEEEVNARIKDATDNLRQEFIKSTEETLKTIKQQKDIECNQIKIDMANWSTKLFELSLKKYIRDGTIYNFIHALEEKDGKLYPNTSR